MHRISRREFVRTGVVATASATVARRAVFAASANEVINLGFISCGGRAGGLMGAFRRIDGVRIAGLCDPDETRLGAAKKRFPQAKAWIDARRLLDDPGIDAVVVATCNHWHCLAALWAMEAGKDVYVEKPLSHTQWEGQQVVAAAKKYARICQVGTQQRSDPMQAEIQRFLHDEKALGKILYARVNRYGIRLPIGKRATPLPIPKGVDYNLWLGPAQDQPIYRDKLQYDWHWDWNTGSGEMGNWGVHVLDDMRNNVLRDKVSLPLRILGGGGRVAWKDAGQTPNVHFVYFDTGTIPVIMGLSNIPAKPGSKRASPHPGPGSGYIAYCEGGRLEGQRGRAVAVDQDGKQIRKFSGDSGRNHQRNFIDAVRKHDPSILNAPVAVGNLSTGWCNLANITVRAGSAYSQQQSQGIAPDSQPWSQLLDNMRQLLDDHGIDIEGSQVRLSPVLELDPQSQRFIGPNAGVANPYLKRKYRAPFVVREVTG
jgi:predicted dehydrogenase